MNDGTFDRHDIKIQVGATGRKDRFEFFYGGAYFPDGDGHEHVVSNDGENIHYWRLSASEGGNVVIDDHFSFEKLRDHGVY